VFIEN